MAGGGADRGQGVRGNQNVVLGQVDHSTVEVTIEGGARRQLPAAAQLAELLPPIPPGFVDRSLVRDTVAAVLGGAGDDGREVRVLRGAGGFGKMTGATVVLRGAGGFGKTTAAIAVARTAEVLTTFSDGVLWINLGPSPDVVAALQGLCGLLSIDDRPLASIDEGASRLALALSSRRILLVVDDVWDERHLAPFLLGGGQTVRLVTSRHRLRTVPATDIAVGEMSATESVRMLAADEVLQTTTDVEPAFRLAERLGRWPLLLRLVSRVLAEWTVGGAMSVDDALATILEHIGDQGITAFDDLDPLATGRDSAVGRTLDLSLSLLPEAEQQRLFELGVLRDEPRTETAVAAALWGSSEVEARRLAVRFDALGLIDLDGGWLGFRIHRVVRELLASRLSDALAVHRRLAALWSDPFALEPERDRYALRHLVAHLAILGDTDRLGVFATEPWQQHLRRLNGSDVAFVAGAVTATDVLARLGHLAEAATAKVAALNLQIAGDRLPTELVALMVRLDDHAGAKSYMDLVGDRVRRAELHVVAAEANPSDRTVDEALDVLRDVKDRWHFVVMMARLATAATEVHAGTARELVARARAEIAKLDSPVDRYRLGLPLAACVARLDGEVAARTELERAAGAVTQQRPSEGHALASTALVELAGSGRYWPECLPTPVQTVVTIDAAVARLVEARAARPLVDLVARSDPQQRRRRAGDAALGMVLAGDYDTAADLLRLADAAPVDPRRATGLEPATARAIVRGAVAGTVSDAGRANEPGSAEESSSLGTFGEAVACHDLGCALRLATSDAGTAGRMLRDFLDWDAGTPPEWNFFVRQTTYTVALHAALDARDIELVRELCDKLGNNQRVLIETLRRRPTPSAPRALLVTRLIEASRGSPVWVADAATEGDDVTPDRTTWALVQEATPTLDLPLAVIRLADEPAQRDDAVAAARLHVAGLSSSWWRCRQAAAVGLAALDNGARGAARALAMAAVDDLLETEDPMRPPVAVARLAVSVSTAGGLPPVKRGRELLMEALSDAKSIEEAEGHAALMDAADSLSAVAPPFQTWASSERLLGGTRTEALGAVAEAAVRLNDYKVLGLALRAAAESADRTTIVRTVLGTTSIRLEARLALADRVLASTKVLDDWGRAITALRRAELAVADANGTHDTARLVEEATVAVRLRTGSVPSSLLWRLAGLRLTTGSTQEGLDLLREWSRVGNRPWRSDETLGQVTTMLSRHRLPEEAAAYARLVSIAARRPKILASVAEHHPGDHAAAVDRILDEATTLASALVDPWDRRHALLAVARSAFHGARFKAATNTLGLLGTVDDWAGDLLSGWGQAVLPAASVDWLLEAVRDESLERLSRADRAAVALQLALLCDASGHPDAPARLRRAAGEAAVSNVVVGDPALARLVSLGLAKAGRFDEAVAVIGELADAQGAVLVALEVHDSLGPDQDLRRRSAPILDLAVTMTRRCEHPGVRDRLLAATATRYFAIRLVDRAVDAVGAVRSQGIQVAAVRAIVDAPGRPTADLDAFVAAMLRHVDRIDVFWALAPAVFEGTPTSERLESVDVLLATDQWTRKAKAAAIKARRRS